MKNDKNNFKEIVESNKKIALKKLVNEMNNEKLRVLCKFLDESGINYDHEIKDYYKLIKSLNKELDKENQKIVADKCHEIDKSFDELINDLSNGSTNAFDNFLKKLNNIVKPISIGLALNTAVRLAPTPVTKLIPMGISVLYSGYKLVKNHKYKKIVTLETKLNEKLQELEFEYDEKGKLIDTRFTEEEQKIIRNKLKEMNIQFIDVGYQSLRTVIYNLDSEQKTQLIMSLSGIIDRKQFDKELKKYHNPSIFTKRSFLPVTTAATSGIIMAMQTVLNGMIVDGAVSEITENSILGKLSGAITSVLTLIGKDTAIIKGETVLLGVVLAELMRIITKVVGIMKKKITNKKLMKEFMQIEQSKYQTDNLKEQEMLIEQLKNSDGTKHIGEIVIIEIITAYIKNNLKVEISATPKNIYELSEIIKSLDSANRDKIKKLLDEFKYFNDRPNNQFLRKVEKILKVTGMGAILGLAGMSVVDIFTRGEFLSNLSNELFFTQAPRPDITVVEHPKTITTDLGAGLVRINENGDAILETTYKVTAGNEAFNTHCNLCYNEELLKTTGKTLEEYMGNYTLKDYVAYRDVADVLINSGSFTPSDIEQIEYFRTYLEKKILERENLQNMADVGSVIIGLSTLADLANTNQYQKRK